MCREITGDTNEVQGKHSEISSSSARWKYSVRGEGVPFQIDCSPSHACQTTPTVFLQRGKKTTYSRVFMMSIKSVVSRISPGSLAVLEGLLVLGDPRSSPSALRLAESPVSSPSPVEVTLMFCPRTCTRFTKISTLFTKEVHDSLKEVHYSLKEVHYSLKEVHFSLKKYTFH